jgi:cysteine desulfurase
MVHCAGAPRLPHTSNIAVLGTEAQTMLVRLDLRGFAVSAGSACASGAPEPSKVLLAMGLPVEEARSSMRVSFGPVNTAADVDAFLEALAEEAAALRGAAVGAPLLL